MVTRAWKLKAVYAAAILSISSLTYAPESHARYVPGEANMCEVATTKRDKQIDLEIEKVTTAHEIMTAERTGMIECTQLMNDAVSSLISQIGFGGSVIGVFELVDSFFDVTGGMCDSATKKVKEVQQKILQKASPALGSLEKIGEYVSIGQEAYGKIKGGIKNNSSTPPMNPKPQPQPNPPTSSTVTAPVATPSINPKSVNADTSNSSTSSLDQLRKIFNSGE